MCVPTGFASSNPPEARTADHFKDQGDSFLEQHKDAEALEAYQKALELNPAMASARVGLGRVYARAKEYNKAIEQMEVALRVDSTAQREVLPKLIFLCLFQNDVKAATYLSDLLRIDERLAKDVATEVINARIYGLKEIDGGFRVEHYFREGSTKRVLEVAKEADPFIEAGEPEKALSVYQQFVSTEDLTPKEKAVVLHTIGMLHSVNLHQPQEGISYLRQAAELDPGELAFRVGLIEAHRSLQEYPEALDHINSLLALDPTSKYGLFEQGVIYSKTKEWRKAVESWGRLREIDPILFAMIEDEYEKAERVSGPRRSESQ